MDIKILKNKDYQNGSLLNQNLLLETAESESRYDNIKKLVYNIYDFEKNIRYEILPRIEKHKLGEIHSGSCDKRRKSSAGTAHLRRRQGEADHTRGIYSARRNSRESCQTRANGRNGHNRRSC